jgi:rRNA maturation endonuclease Nob1
LSDSKDKEDEKREKPVKLEDVAQETGVLVGKGVRKTWRVMKSFGKGVVDTLDDGGTQKAASTLSCSHCGASVPTDASFCAKCGKKLEQ